MRARVFLVGVAVVALLGTLLGAGCSRTEMIVAIAATELGVPGEIDRIAITVTNPRLDPEAQRPVFVSPQTALCATGQTPGSTCTTLPTTLTLYPGDAQPNETVRVQLDALLQGRVVLSQAAIFTFAKGKSGRLTFDLYRDCLQLECATVDQACAEGGVCRNLTPVVDSDSTDMTPSSIALVGATSAPVAANAASFTVNVPSDAVANDHLLLAYSAVYGGSAVINAPGWKQLTWLEENASGQPRMWVFERIVSSNEPATHTFTVETISASVDGSFHLLHHRGARGVEGLRTLPEAATPTIPSVNVQGPGRVLLALVQRPYVENASCPAPSGFTQILNGPVMVYESPVAAGMTGDRALVCTQVEPVGVVALALVP